MKYTGHERDVVDGQGEPLDYMHARYYSASTGRFLSVDLKEQREPLSLPQGWNRYAYAQNNPLKYFDPDGEETKLAIGGRTDRNPVGHVAIIINDQVYSFGTNWSGRGANQQDWGASAQTYLDSQAGHRQTDLLTLNITPEQEQKLQQHLNANNPNAPGAAKYSELTNSCTTVTQNALVQTGTMPAVALGPVTGRGPTPISTGSAVLPGTVGAYAQGAGIVTNVQTVGKEPKVGWFRTIVNAVKEYF
jgi:RHS repeat-associated protein